MQYYLLVFEMSDEKQNTMCHNKYMIVCLFAVNQIWTFYFCEQQLVASYYLSWKQFVAKFDCGHWVLCADLLSL